MFEVIAAPQEQPEQAQEERHENPLKARLTLALSNSPKASLGAHPIISNYDTFICLYYLCIRFRKLFETLVA